MPEGTSDQGLQVREVREEFGLETGMIGGIQRRKATRSGVTDAVGKPVDGTRNEAPQDPGDR